VADGEMTQEQADERLATVITRTTEMVNDTEMGPHQQKQQMQKPRLSNGQTGGRFGNQDGDTGSGQTTSFSGRTRGGFGSDVPRGLTA
jgi:hypothetical protein